MTVASLDDLNKSAQILIAHYGHTRVDDYEVFMHTQSALWYLRERGESTAEQKMDRLACAMADLTYLLDEDPEDPNLTMAMRVCHKISTELEPQLDDFSQWAAELGLGHA